jgi:hypothetical protein
MLEKLFHLKENGTNVQTELIAGLTTFVTMVYILALNPSILCAAPGLENAGGSVLFATAVASAIACFCMAAFSNKPFALSAGLLYMKDNAGQVWCYCRESEAPTHIGYDPASGMAELGDYYNYSNSSGSGTNRKYVTRLLLRLECQNAMTVKIMYDSSGTWQNAATIPAMTKNSRVCSVPIMRCDHYRIRLEGSGEWKLFSIAEDYVTGSGSNATVTV